MTDRPLADVIKDVRSDIECRKRFGDKRFDDEILLDELTAAYAAIRALVSGGDREPHRAAIERAAEAGRG